MQVYDIVFVGSGLSSSATLYHILQGLQQRKYSGCLKIAVIEKNNEFFKGIPYGNRSSVHSLTINPIKDFFQDQEKPLFFAWLNGLKQANYPDFTDTEKSVLNSWIEKNADKLNDTDLDGLYIPRFLYGIYLSQKLKNIIADCKINNLASVELIGGEAIDVTRIEDKNQYNIAIEKIDKQLLAITTTILVLGTGSLDTIQLNKTQAHPHLCIDDIYNPSLAVNIKKLQDALAQLEPEKRNILVIGANASASEIIHMLQKVIRAQTDGFNQISVLSTSSLPDRLYVNLDYDHLLENLTRLQEAGNYTADDLMLAIEKDVKKAADVHGLSVGKIHYSLSDKVVKMQQSLGADEGLNFFNNHGWSFTRITRRTSEAYYFTGRELIDQGKLNFIKGRFVKLCDEQNSADGLTFVYKKQGEETVCEKAFPIIINCVGAEPISNSSSTLIKNLIKKGLCRINDNSMGIAVDERFAAGVDFYIIGPLMAGIYNAKFKFWHLENAKRLNGLGAILADTILKTII